MDNAALEASNQARIGVIGKDIPLTRDPSWTRVEDPAAFELSHPNLVRLSKGVPTAESFVLDFLSLEQVPMGPGAA